MKGSSDPPRTYRELLWRSAKDAYAPTFAVLGVIITGGAWAFPAIGTREVKLPFSLALALVIASLITLLVLINAARTAFRFMQRPLPAMVSARKAPGMHALCFLDPSPLFSHGTGVSFYLMEEGQYELLLGVGGVINVQGNGLIQVALRDVLEGQESHIETLLKNDADFLKRLRVKPTVPDVEYRLLQGLK